MKIKLYIVTYNNNEILNNWALKTLFESDFPLDNNEVYIINNHSNIHIEPQYVDKIKILNNDLRPDFSTGHLARNWNQAIINGFKNLNEPDCDLVIACQNDTKFCKNWYSKLIITMLKDGYKYITCGVGDQLQIFTADSIKNIGLYDERFCNIGYQEADYFLRALLNFCNYSSINDYGHGRIFNTSSSQLIEYTQTGLSRKEETHLDSSIYHKYSEKFWNIKWDINDTHWDTETIFYAKPRVKNYIMYPYFEKDILNLEEKYY
jgi:hypothetical protein